MKRSSSERLALKGGKAIRTKPFHDWPICGPEEEEALLRVLRSGKWWRYAFGQGVELTEPDGEVVAEAVRFQREFARAHDCRYAVVAANGTASLEMGIRAMNLNIGDEVIVPAYTYVASATCVLQNNLLPIFVDVQPDTYNIDPRRVEEAVTDRTRAIMPVHFGGQVADMDALMALSKRHGIPLIEDAAHAHLCEWQGRKAGSFGLFGSFSFQSAKNMTSGEGGILCTNDRAFAETCESLLWAGRKMGRPWYEHHRLGWNYRITEFQSAILHCQFQRLNGQLEHRKPHAAYLTEQLQAIEGIAPLATDPRATRHGHHIYMFRYDQERIGLARELFIRALNAEGIPAFSGYTFPLYKNPMFLNKQFINGSFPLGTKYHADIDYARFEAKCPVAERACRSEAVWLPHNLFLGTRQDMDDIVAAVRKVLAQKDQLAQEEKR